MSLRGSHENVISEYIFWRHMLLSGQIFRPSICPRLQGFSKSCTVRKLLTFDLLSYLPSMWFICWPNFAMWEKCFLSRILCHKFYDFWKKIATICLPCGRMIKTCFCFHILNIAKFDYYSLWMIANWATSQNWEKETSSLDNFDINYILFKK
jgi:hypothetical protein